MTRHIFLTGQKQVGKSTLLRKILQAFPGSLGGFFTVRTNEYLKNAYSVHMFCVGEEAVPSEKNLLFRCGSPEPNTAGRFERLGCRALAKCGRCSLIVMDELGPHEAEAAAFRQAVLKRIEEDTPILGVLQAPASAFWPDVAEHPAVQIWEITQENRNQAGLAEAILSEIKRHISGC